MGVISYDMEIKSSLSAAKLFKAFVLDVGTLINKALPNVIKSVEILQGDGGAGTIKLVHFGEGGPVPSVKHHVEELDKDNMSYKYSIVDGEALMPGLQSISYVIKIEPSGHGSVCKHNTTFHFKAGSNINEDEIKAGKERAAEMIKAVEAYVQANPDY
uniref:Probable intracellular pathogenesis-related protein T1 n=1 Tax=Catharanthus roseus TaxID=4058 RepID=IPRT1_CATRO|nr:RecName: Full=Probable intracellular pathogenesis-related protein T1 [Catharanthus roseus]